MSHDQESRDLVAENLLKNMGSILSGVADFMETAERIITSLHLLAKAVESMEEDGSLVRLAELLQEAGQSRGQMAEESSPVPISPED
ncbi:MAG: hypothetical protein GX998_08450 [Firmicutes bacterium]|nr:hypothetical protein [Bacillota bacterium]